MTEKKEEFAELILSDLITGENHHIVVKGRDFFFYPITLSMTFRISKVVRALEMNPSILSISPYIEVYRLAQKKKRECCTLLSLHTTPNNKNSFFDKKSQIERAEYFEENLSTEAIAMLVMYAITSDKTDMLIQHFGIDKEQEKLHKIIEIKEKSKKNTVTYGGKSIFGTFLTQLKTLGYSDTEILYERPYTYLRLMIADKADSIYLSDDEMQSLPKEYGGELLIADDASNVEDIEKMLKERGLTING